MFDEHHRICEHNTFLTVVEIPGTPKMGKVCSVPPSFKLAEVCAESHRLQEIEEGTEPFPELAPSERNDTLDFVTVGADVKTTPRRPSFSSVSTGSCTAATTADIASECELCGSEAEDESDERSSQSSAAQMLEARETVQVRLCDLIPPPPVAPARARLNVKAKAFVSKAPVRPKECAFRSQAEVVVAAIQVSLACAGVLHVASTPTSTGGWSIMAQIPAGVPSQKQAILLSSQQALHRAVERSRGLCILGNQAMASMLTPDGFTTTLCGVRSRAAACWDLLSTGFCHRGHACYWEHPSYQVTISVQVQQCPRFASGVQNAVPERNTTAARMEAM